MTKRLTGCYRTTAEPELGSRVGRVRRGHGTTAALFAALAFGNGRLGREVLDNGTGGVEPAEFRVQAQEGDATGELGDLRQVRFDDVTGRGFHIIG